MSNSEFGSDGQIHDTGPVDPFEISEPGAAEQLRAFEDKHLGEDAPRFEGKIEKGHGSLFSRMPPEMQKAHAAIEKTAETEQKLADARAKLAVAESEHNTAVAYAEDASRFGG